MSLMSLLSSEQVIDLTTIARVKNGLTYSTADSTVLSALITSVSQRAMRELLMVPIEKKERSEYFPCRKNQRDFWVLSNRIDTTTAPVVVFNTDQPRVWTDSGDVIDSDYVICDATMAKEGKVHVEYDLNIWTDYCPSCVKITYTGGFAKAVSGTTPADITTALLLTVDGQIIADAIDRQVRYEFRRDDYDGIASQNQAGQQVTFIRPARKWLYEVEDTLRNMGRRQF